MQINSQSGWEDLVALFGLRDTTANCGLALKQVYLRYLDSYEKAHFLGDDNDDPEDSWWAKKQLLEWIEHKCCLLMQYLRLNTHFSVSLIHI